MKIFLSEVWHDLREKRMWPVAAVLVVALVALPVVLSAKRKEAPPAPASANASPAKLPAVGVSDDTVFSSNLGAFKAKDPFKPGRSGRQNLPRGSAEVIASLSGSADGFSAGAVDAGAASGSESSGSSAASGAEGGSGSGGSGSGGPTPRTRRVTYSYVADVTFGRAGQERGYRGLQRLEMLPNSDSPLLVFLGATRSGGDAVFLVDSNLRQAGEGSCADSACSLLSIGPGAEHRFRDDRNREYVLVIDRIRRVKAGAASTARAGASSRSASTDRRDRDDRRRGLVSSLLVDTETVTTGIASSPAGKGR